MMKIFSILLGVCVVCEFFLLFMLLAGVFPMVGAVVGSPNATVSTILEVGNVFPEVLTVSINNGATIDLTPNTTTSVLIYATVRDFNGEGDIDTVLLDFFDMGTSVYADPNDLNNHYSNDTCVVNLAYGDGNEANVTCHVALEYFANNATWNATFFINDSLNTFSYGSATQTVNTLLALALPDIINYGLVNATAVSDEIAVNVTNVGNVMVNLSLSGYARTVGDGYAMNCSFGSVQNISINYEKYNLTSSNSGLLDLTAFESGNYTNLTASVQTRQFDLGQRFNDTLSGVDDTNATFWRMYVPSGVAGNCTGNIVFGATQTAGS